MISRLEKEKNIKMAIKAFSQVLEKYPNIGLIIVGEGKERTSLVELTEKLNIKKSIIFENWQSDQEILISYYKTCDIFLNTSWYEGYGMTLKEAQMAGCKIISTDVGIAREVGAEVVGFGEGEIADTIICNIY